MATKNQPYFRSFHGHECKVLKDPVNKTITVWNKKGELMYDGSIQGFQQWLKALKQGKAKTLVNGLPEEKPKERFQTGTSRKFRFLKNR